MNPIKNLVAKFRGRPRNDHNFIGAESFRTRNPYSLLSCYESDAYASIYPSVKAITNEFMTIMPFAINANGERQQNVPTINALYHPNQSDSSVAFFEKLAVMNLTHRKTYLLVWRREGKEAKPGGDINPQNIAGFTFLERPAINRRDGKTFYNIGAQEFNEKEVIVIPGGVDPSNLYYGYAPGEASRRWASLDQYIADYQSGFFENGAVPSGQFIITSATKDDFNDTVDKLQAAHRGAGNNNNVTYTPRPVNPDTGKPADAKIEWIPFASTNKEIDFKNLFEQANNRIDSTFGVPASVRGVGENNNYATAQTDRQNFIRNTVSPLALRIYTQITHELNRITNGLGVAITYKLDLPPIADEVKVQAETKKTEVETVLLLTAQGYSLDSVVDALELSVDYKKLELGDLSTTTDTDDPEVDEGAEVNDSPDPDKIDGITPVNVVIINDAETGKAYLEANGGSSGKNPKAAKKTDEEELEDVTRRFMQSQIDKAVKDLQDEPEPTNEVTGIATEEDQDKFVDEAMVIIVAIMVAGGALKYAEGIDMLKAASIATDVLDEFILSETAETSYRMYLKRVAQSYSNDTKTAIQNILALADEKGYTRAETEKALRGIMNTDEWRVKRLAVTETNRSQSISGVEAMKQIQTESGVEIEKGLLHTGGDAPCEFCATLLNRWVIVDQEFVPLGAAVIGQEGGVLLNNFVANEGYDIHPNGHCVSQFRIRGAVEDASDIGIMAARKDGLVKVECSECGRWLADTDQTMIATMKCSGSQCKKVNNIKVVTATSTEDQIKYKFKEATE